MVPGTDSGLDGGDRFLELERDTPHTAAWVAAQRRLYDSWFASQALRARWRDRLRELRDYGRVSVPTARGNRLVYTSHSPSEQQARLLVQDGDTTERTVIGDWYGQAFHLGTWSVSPDGSRAAVQLCQRGADVGDVHVVSLPGGELGTVAIPRLRTSTVSWLVHPRTREEQLLYARHEEAVLDNCALAPGLYAVPPSGGAPVHLWRAPGEDGPCFIIPLVSPDRLWLVMAVRYGADTRNALWLAEVPDGLAGPLLPRLIHPAGVSAAIPRFGMDGRLYVLARDRDDRGELSVVDLTRPERHRWSTLVPADAEARAVRFALAGDWVAVVRERDDTSEVVMTRTRPRSRRTYPVPLPAPGYVGMITGSGDSGGRVWFEYGNHGTPMQVLELAAAGAGRHSRPTVWYDPRPATATVEHSVEMRSLSSHDGATVEATVLRRDREMAPVPTILAVYGGFGSGLRPVYRPEAQAWVEAGGAYVLAHVRGDGHRGSAWQRAGSGRQKPNAVYDLLAIAHHLLDTGIAAADGLGLSGFSNGGMIALAAMVQRPDVVSACAASAPVTDLLRFPILGDGRSWLTEYGSPYDPGDRAILLRYSPYHNVRSGVYYPATLLFCGSGDTRVSPAHARKMCAVLQAATRRRLYNAPILLREEDGVGHSHLPHRLDVDLGADRLTFFSKQLGLCAGTRPVDLEP